MLEGPAAHLWGWGEQAGRQGLTFFSPRQADFGQLFPVVPQPASTRPWNSGMETKAGTWAKVSREAGVTGAQKCHPSCGCSRGEAEAHRRVCVESWSHWVHPEGRASPPEVAPACARVGAPALGAFRAMNVFRPRVLCPLPGVAQGGFRRQAAACLQCQGAQMLPGGCPAQIQHCRSWGYCYGLVGGMRPSGGPSLLFLPPSLGHPPLTHLTGRGSMCPPRQEANPHLLLPGWGVGGMETSSLGKSCPHSCDSPLLVPLSLPPCLSPTTCACLSCRGVESRGAHQQDPRPRPDREGERELQEEPVCAPPHLGQYSASKAAGTRLGAQGPHRLAAWQSFAPRGSAALWPTLFPPLACPKACLRSLLNPKVNL